MPSCHYSVLRLQLQDHLYVSVDSLQILLLRHPYDIFKHNCSMCVIMYIRTGYGRTLYYGGEYFTGADPGKAP